ncbi:hypothetical protein CNR22_06690 [Sphingobacteriaceae bacterium]|nr:hypothetical protein CNR22_06690 [Sphingobacteriaceae bacterium]
MKKKIHKATPLKPKHLSRLILLCACIFFSYSLSAQLSLTQSFNEPQPGDIETTYRMDTSAYSGGLPNSISGSNVVWNFTNLKGLQPAFSSNYLSAASVTSAASYTNCNLVQESSGVYTYFRSATTPTTQTELIGINTPYFAATFTNTGIIAKYPLNFGSNSTDNMSGAFTSTIAGNGNCSGNISTTADGTGTLNLPGNLTLTNVLRVKSVQTITLISNFIPLGTLKQSVYHYYHGSQKFPVLSISYEAVTTLISPTPTITSSVMGSTNFFVTGIKETLLESDAIRLYPNPAQTSVTMQQRGDLKLIGCKIYNHSGELVLTNTSDQTISLAGLAAGLYHAEIHTDKGSVRKKIIKE